MFLTAKSAARRTGALSFSSSLQNALNKKAKLLYVVFDVLFVDDKDLRQTAAGTQKTFESFVAPRATAALQRARSTFGKREFAKAQRANEEGVIAKRATGLYYSGKRTREWLKFKACA